MNLALIPAKSESWRLPGKNIKEFMGQPIIKYSIDAALESGLFERVEVSTDSDKIGAIAAGYGAVYSQARDETLCKADVPMVDVVVSILKYYRNQGKEYEYCCMIYPCAPFLTATLLYDGYHKLKTGYDVVFPVYKDSAHVERSMIIQDGKIQSKYLEYNNQNSSKWPTTYQHAGQFFWIDCERLLKRSEPPFPNKTLMPANKYGIIVDSLTAIDIDTPEDWEKAETIYRLFHDKKDGWVKNHRKLIDWLRVADEKIEHGQIIINYHEGKITHYDLCPRERMEVEKGG